MPFLTRCAARLLAGALILALPAALTPAPAAAAGTVRVRLDGRLLPLDPPATVVDGRTLVPLRGVFEALGATVHWDGATRTITVSARDRYLKLAADRRLVCLDAACDQAEVLDVPPQIRDGRAFVPLRFVATALGAGVEWDPAAREVLITSAGPAPAAERPVTIVSPGAGAVITGPVELRARVAGVPAARIRWMLIRKETGRGPLLALGDDPQGTYRWRPDPALRGRHLLVAAAYDAAGRLVGAHAVPVEVAPDPQVTLTGPAPGAVITGPVSLRTEFGFVATHVTYERVDPTTGARTTLATADPYGPWTWSPGVADNGRWHLVATAYDRTGRAYPSAAVPVEVRVAPVARLEGLRAGQAITGPVALRVQVNFPVERVQFLLDDGTVIAEGGSPWQSYRWFPTPDQNGRRWVSAAVRKPGGEVQYLDGVPVEVQVAPTLLLATVRPNQVITGTVSLRAEANVPLRRVEFRLVDPGTGRWRVVAGGEDPRRTYQWTPQAGDGGNWELQAVALDGAGRWLASGRVPVRVYTGKVYSARPIVPKDQFQALATRLALPARDRTGMSAALQVAQAIHETGWGQYVPVDKYTGQFSYNLFGIKGKGPAGSVVHTTWEEYGGVRVTLDDAFRAYHSVEEGWQDHKDLLLTRERYAGFRAVMTDPIQGAWALWRAGYATDSQYALKLISLMQRYNLFTLDEVEP